MDSGGIPGMALAILEREEIAWVGGFGVRAKEDHSPVDEHTVFEAASLSKPVVAYVTLALVEAKRLDLDRPLLDYVAIPELADDRAGRITTRMVLAHMTGLQNERIGDQPLTLAFDPGERFRYSGEGFLLLQRVLETVSGKSLDELSRTVLLEPLGMMRSGFVWRDDFMSNAAVGHGNFRDPLTPTHPPVGRAPSSFHTTAHDYALFVRSILRQEVLSSTTFEDMFAGHVHVAPGIDWGLGWALETTDGERAAWHWGDNSNSGFTAFVLAYPDHGNAILYFANSRTGLSIVRGILAILGGTHVAADYMNYETHDAPTRRVRLAIDGAARLRGGQEGLRVYERLRTEFPSSAFPESLLNDLGYRFLRLNRPADAIAFFERNAQEFPRSSNAFDSLGDGYAASGDKNAAIASYLRSYELDPRNERALNEAARLRGEP
ncbi:MAG TPA: serine hydrolase [Gemmatimonadota bacterium]|nr:serine hydrolase [Gemmatimonadota bacterium]